MINFEKIESSLDFYKSQFKDAKPYEHIVIDGFCDEAKLSCLYNNIPDPIEEGINRSRDYVFAKNKFEKSNFRQLSNEFSELYSDMMSDRFRDFLKELTGEDVFVDPDFHGGGLHQGGEGSYLDMHVDFNTHPINKKWFRNLNILIYLNKDWKKEYGGELKLRNKFDFKRTDLVEPIFNRCVIMFTRDYTVHGYDKISFPPGSYRRSLAAYAYSLMDEESKDHRTTVWYPDDSGFIKSTVGKYWPSLVKIKNKIFGSATAKNK